MRLRTTAAAIGAAIAPAPATAAGLRGTMLTGGAVPASTPPPAGGRLSSRLAVLAEPAVRTATADQRARALSLPAAGPASLVEDGGDAVVDVRASTTAKDAGLVTAELPREGRAMRSHALEGSLWFGVRRRRQWSPSAPRSACGSRAEHVVTCVVERVQPFG